MAQLSFWQRLVGETNDYLADLREMRDDLKSVEGWIALGLVCFAGLITVAWIIVSLGYNPANDHILSLLHRFGLRSCKPIDNVGGVVVFIDLFLLLFLTVISIGNALNMMKRVRQGLPREPRDLIISTALMIAAGLGGILYMLKIC